MSSDIIDGGIKLRADKRFYRLHRAFGDAVRSKNRSAIEEVLLRAELSGEQARRTADKILGGRGR
jgi:hypothetical protein